MTNISYHNYIDSPSGNLSKTTSQTHQTPKSTVFVTGSSIKSTNPAHQAFQTKEAVPISFHAFGQSHSGIFFKLKKRGREEFPWIQDIEDQFDVIKEELLSLRNSSGFQPYRGPKWISDIKADDGIGAKSVDSGDWNIFYLFLHDLKFDENCRKCPKTVEIIEDIIPRQYHHSFFSAMNPKTHILKHYGPTNKKLRFHLPLLGVEGSRLRVNDEIKHLKVGEAYVFDDSFEHEAWHDGDATRIILICDFWHPDLTNDEIKFLNILQKVSFFFYKKNSRR